MDASPSCFGALPMMLSFDTSTSGSCMKYRNRFCSSSLMPSYSARCRGDKLSRIYVYSERLFYIKHVLPLPSFSIASGLTHTIPNNPNVAKTPADDAVYMAVGSHIARNANVIQALFDERIASDIIHDDKAATDE